MTRRFLIATVFLLIASARAYSLTPWRELTPSGASDVFSIKYHAGRLYVGTNLGLFVSSDRGQTWNPLSQGLIAGGIYTLEGNEQTLLAIVDHRAVFRLSPDKTSWVPSSSGLPGNANLQELAVIGNNAFVTSEQSFENPSAPSATYRSRDGGQSWSPFQFPRIGQATGFMGTHGTTIFIYAGNPQTSGLFRSTDQGESFTEFPVDQNIDTPNALVVTSDYVFIGCSGRIWRTPVTPSLPWNGFKIQTTSITVYGMVANERGLLAYMYDGILGSKGGTGERWVPAGLGGKRVSAIGIMDSDLLAAVEGGRIFISSEPFPDAVALSAASYGRECAPGSIAAVFGDEFSTSTGSAATIPLPNSLAGTTVSVLDTEGRSHPAGLFFVSPSQVNLLIPESIPQGEFAFVVRNEQGIEKTGLLSVGLISPSLFSANSDGVGVPAGFVLRVSPNGTQTTIPLFRYSDVWKKQMTNPIRLTPNSDKFYLVLYGTGWRFRSTTDPVFVIFNQFHYGDLPPSFEANLTYVGPAPGYAGLDQMNIQLSGGFGGFSLRRVGVSRSSPVDSVTQFLDIDLSF